MVAALVTVIGLFLICAWLLRRGARSTASAIPPDVVSILGRIPLTSRQEAQLIRVGNKLVLISMTPNGAQPLAEVTDPSEVDRLVGLCQQSSPHSTTKAFEQVFQQLSQESPKSGMLGDEPLFGPKVTPFAASRQYRGDAVRA
jgi:flagellar biogenesis protein FliO